MKKAALHVLLCLLCICCAFAATWLWVPVAHGSPLLRGIGDKAAVLELMLRRTPKNQCENYVANARKAGEGDYATIFFWLNKYEEQRCSVEALNAAVWGWLGRMYENGRGTKQDIDMAIHYYAKSAEKGDVDAQYFLGCCLVKHKQDYENGIVWLKKAALTGDVDAQYMLGIVYDDASNPHFNLKEAFKYFEMGAKQGEVDCSYELGLMYYYGEGTVEDADNALMLLKYAAERGEEDAAFYLSGILFTDYELTKARMEEVYLWLEVSKHFGSTLDKDKELEKQILSVLPSDSKAKIDAQLSNVYSEIENRKKGL